MLVACEPPRTVDVDVDEIDRIFERHRRAPRGFDDLCAEGSESSAGPVRRGSYDHDPTHVETGKEEEPGAGFTLALEVHARLVDSPSCSGEDHVRNPEGARNRPSRGSRASSGKFSASPSLVRAKKSTPIEATATRPSATGSEGETRTSIRTSPTVAEMRAA
jgi:hypothetical protein